ncbi:MAG: ATP-binding protein [Oscillospiraceae bacterium]|jgi:predicted AAA+ superfamily ATPase|nr:ATP-binding protein [Oscillospiraceae bacterium]
MLIDRPLYLAQLERLRDKQIIKVITGIRRCGKSTLLDLFAARLIESGVPENRIIRLNLENPENADLLTYQALYSEIVRCLQPDGKNYILLDEVQMAEEFQRAVDGLFIREDCDVYVTGSNARLLSGELATLLSGRYVEIRMMPLSFAEYVSAVGSGDLAGSYRRYLETGSFPYTLGIADTHDCMDYLEGIYNTVVVKDVGTRRGIANVAALERVARFAFDNIGNLTSVNAVTKALNSGGRGLSVNTVEGYYRAFTESFLLYKAERFDVKGKQYLMSGAKYYAVDMGLRRYLLGAGRAYYGRQLENIVYLELLRRYRNVYVGKVGDMEIDFVVTSDAGQEYFQVAYTVIDDSGDTLRRELAPLERIHDHNPKYLLTMDVVPNASHNGIRQVNALDWLLGRGADAN